MNYRCWSKDYLSRNFLYCIIGLLFTSNFKKKVLTIYMTLHKKSHRRTSIGCTYWFLLLDLLIFLSRLLLGHSFVLDRILINYEYQVLELLLFSYPCHLVLHSCYATCPSLLFNLYFIFANCSTFGCGIGKH